MTPSRKAPGGKSTWDTAKENRVTETSGPARVPHAGAQLHITAS